MEDYIQVMNIDYDDDYSEYDITIDEVDEDIDLV